MTCGLLGAILVHARHVQVIQEDHQTLAHGRSIGILGAFLRPILMNWHQHLAKHGARDALQN